MSTAVMDDIFTLMMTEYDDSEEYQKVKQAIDEALFNCLDKFGRINISYIAQQACVPIAKAIDDLKYVIYQDPGFFVDDEHYDITKGWVICAKYLSGNLRNKLMAAIEMNKRFPGKFENNIEAIRRIISEGVDIEDIYIRPGAPWIPTFEYENFFRERLELEIEVSHYKDSKTYKVKGDKKAKESATNIITYGVIEDRNIPLNRNSKASSLKDLKVYFTALEIFEDTLNGIVVKANDYTYTYDDKGKKKTIARLNKNKTIEAQNIQNEMCNMFCEWVREDEERAIRFEEYYNTSLVGYVFTKYDGSFLTLPDLNPEVILYKYQRDVIARVLLSESNVLIAHDVGAGKTYEYIPAIHELYRLGMSKRNLIIVPTHMLSAAASIHKLLYPNDRILVVTNKDMTPKNRNQTLARVSTGDYVAIYMASSSFDMIDMSRGYYVKKFDQRILELKASIFSARDRHEKKAIESIVNKVQKKREEFLKKTGESPYITYDQLGITTLVVDEAHEYRNISLATSANYHYGATTGCSKSNIMLEKVHNTDKVIFATGTPITNSISDIFALQLYLQPQVLKFHGIDTFDSWASTFVKRETKIESDYDTNSSTYRVVTRLSSYHNIGELMSMFSQVCDFYHIETSAEGIPQFNGYIDVCVPKSDALREYIESLSERINKIKANEVSVHDDNILKVFIDGRSSAIDLGLVDKLADLTERNKVDYCVDNVYEMYVSHPGTSQIVFCDVGTPKSGYNVYDSIYNKLVARGVPSNEIAYVHDATTEKARLELFEMVNKGKVRVIIGSTQKLGVGVNVQEKLIAIHHLSIPWRPADFTQRNGRILRKGNTCHEVYIYRYTTMGTLDAYLWQILENKQIFISSFLAGTYSEREMRELDEMVLSLAEMKALTIGNPLIRTRFEVYNELEREKILSRERQKQIQKLHVVIGTAPKKIDRFMRLAETADLDYREYKARKAPVSNPRRIALGGEIMEALRGEDERGRGIYYQGFKIVVPSDMAPERPYIIAESDNGGSYYCKLDTEQTEIGITKSIDYLLDHLYERAYKLRLMAEDVKKEVQLARADIEKGNSHLAMIDGLKALLDELDTEIERIADEAKSA